VRAIPTGVNNERFPEPGGSKLRFIPKHHRWIRKKHVLKSHPAERDLVGVILKRSPVYPGGAPPWFWVATSHRVFWLVQEDSTHMRYPVLVITWSISDVGDQSPLKNASYGETAYFQEGDHVSIAKCKPQKMLFWKNTQMLTAVSGGDVKYRTGLSTVVVDPVFLAHGDKVIKLETAAAIQPDY
jgi:hypothetical protein